MKKIIVTTAVIIFSMAIIAYAAPDSNSIVKDDIEYYMQTDKSVYNLGEEVQMLYRVTNLGDEEKTFFFGHPLQYNFHVTNTTNGLIWRYYLHSSECAFCRAVSRFSLQPDEFKEFDAIWDMTNDNDAHEESDDFTIQPGNYNVTGMFWYGLCHGSYCEGRYYVPISVPIEIIPPPAITYYVNATEGSDDNDGLSSQTPFATIQKAIDSAFDGDTVEVWPGTYTGDGNRDIDFLGKALTICSTDPNDPDIVAATIIDCNGTEAEPHRGFNFQNDEDANSVLNGLTVTNGYAHKGGGIYLSSASPTITNCTFIFNSAKLDGGGMYNDSNSIVTNCTFIWNSTARYGGGMYNHDSKSIVTNCTFSGNSAGKGAGMSCYSNYPHQHGPVLTNCTFSGNSASSGGGMYSLNCTPIVTNCIFSDNSAYDGAGMYYAHQGGPVLTNCTFSGNEAVRGGGIMTHDPLEVILTNCILWDDTPNEICLYEDRGSALVSYSDVQGGWDGQGNINLDPCFIEPGYWDGDIWVDGDYHLLPDSPCIDAGDPCYIAEPDETDLDGNPRVIGGRIDMGAYEVTPLDLLLELSENLDAMSLPKGIANSLLAKLDTALQKLEDDNENNDAAAINLLDAFINAVEAQYGKKIPEADADALIEAAQEIIDLLSDE